MLILDVFPSQRVNDNGFMSIVAGSWLDYLLHMHAVPILFSLFLCRIRKNVRLKRQKEKYKKGEY